MEFVLHRPAGALARSIEFLWASRSEPDERVTGAQLPEGGAVVIFAFGPPQGLVAGDGSLTWYRGAWACGEMLEPLRLDSPGGTSLVGARFRPGAAHPAFGLPLAELAGQVVELDALWPESEAVRERLALAPTTARRFRVLEGALAARLRAGTGRGAELVHAALAELAARGPGETVGALAAGLGVTSRHLRRTFAEHVGIGPKALHRVLRFQQVIRAVEAGPPRDWSDVALRCGYFDQAHMNRDFRAFAGRTPTAYTAARSPDPNFTVEP